MPIVGEAHHNYKQGILEWLASNDIRNVKKEIWQGTHIIQKDYNVIQLD